ncbi:uncharacterized protein LY89DRAFT_573032 [Mollisia scopiformis]|uniref:C2H2-type domain-containing protein n=1 Tax=Mollisia scopiformis TaxID=149040 RepID=A0A194XVI7_MOLSC|nr:uncharacterized protein LY89DRAFT_573032 [Mollisia scopiformis]KUJ24340.1 hypothetical protein LY89DRAFT_573032 [Mollisia scopiformis]
MDANTSASSASAATSFTCNVCQAKFENNLQQRAHSKSDWHVYNLKRHVASLPPISAQVYNDQILAIREASTTAEAVASSAFQKSCTVCEKTFFNHTAYQNHFRSSGHAQEVARLEAKDDLSTSMERITLESQEPTTSSDPDTFIPSACLFCKYDSKSLDLNVAHMQKKHGLFIADQDYLLDLETFIGYLFTVISQFHECLYCGSIKSSEEAARSHMISKGHCNLKPDPGSEYEDFYEVASDIEDEDLEAGAKEGKSPEFLVPDDNELRLPSGRILGHRSQARYYRQHTPASGKSPERKAIEDGKESGESNQEQAEGSRNTSRQLTTRTRGEMGMVGVSEAKKRAVMAVEKKMLKAEIRAKSDYRAGLERLGNKQKYFRVSTDCVWDLTK